MCVRLSSFPNISTHLNQIFILVKAFCNLVVVTLCIRSIKVFSTKPEGFPIALVGQTIIGISQMFTLGIPARLAAVWFPYYQISTATALGVFGNQVVKRTYACIYNIHIMRKYIIVNKYINRFSYQL